VWRSVLRVVTRTAQQRHSSAHHVVRGVVSAPRRWQVHARSVRVGTSWWLATVWQSVRLGSTTTLTRVLVINATPHASPVMVPVTISALHACLPPTLYQLSSSACHHAPPPIPTLRYSQHPSLAIVSVQLLLTFSTISTALPLVLQAIFSSMRLVFPSYYWMASTEGTPRLQGIRY
jgi:hypothetical protein